MLAGYEVFTVEHPAAAVELKVARPTLGLTFVLVASCQLLASN